jgi:hypothetical protein
LGGHEPLVIEEYKRGRRNQRGTDGERTSLLRKAAPDRQELFAGARELFADDVVWEAPGTPPTGGVIQGRDTILEQ